MEAQDQSGSRVQGSLLPHHPTRPVAVMKLTHQDALALASAQRAMLKGK